VLYVEEPIFGNWQAHIDVTRRNCGVMVAIPHLPDGLSPDAIIDTQRRLLNKAVQMHIGSDFVLWCYTPIAVQFSGDLPAAAVVYDCMDELSAFDGAPPALKELETRLFGVADVVFTGGYSLYEAKRLRHPNVMAFPSSVDAEHFARARTITEEPGDQVGIERPRIGYFGVIDERIDYQLLAGVAAARPDWHLVMIGPIAKVESTALPRASNLHYLGAKAYADLPRYIAGWNVAMLPFAKNAATRFISPTKTPEYLAAGQPIVSTSIRDVVRTYGQQGLVRIADTVDEFIDAVSAALREDRLARRVAGDAFLTHLSWDGTWLQMRKIIEEAVNERKSRGAAVRNAS